MCIYVTELTRSMRAPPTITQLFLINRVHCIVGLGYGTLRTIATMTSCPIKTLPMFTHSHYVSIDFGTSGCAFAVGLGIPEPKRIRVFSGWNEARMGLQLKCPTILLADPQGKFVSFGDKALDDYKSLGVKAQDYYLFQRFKMKLYDSPV